MLRILSTCLLMLGIGLTVSANHLPEANHASANELTVLSLEKTGAIDPVIVNRLLYICSVEWNCTCAFLEDEYKLGTLTITPTTYRGVQAYDVTFGGTTLCILLSEL